MGFRFSRAASALALAASLSMAATPALARDRGWGGGGWGGGWGHHNDGVSAGDVFAGVLVIGTIAAIASAASKSNRERQASNSSNSDYRGRDSNEQAPRYSDRNDSRSYASNSRGIDSAVDTCVYEVERSNRIVDSVDTVGRDGDGWRVEGRVRGGTSFACAVSNGGRIRSVTVDGHAAYAGDDVAEQAGG
jgi:hypothetical protein